LGHLALGGAGLLTIEATAVEPKGRISAADLGLYSDDNEAALGRVLKACRAYGNTAIGIQLSHSGRKGSAKIQWAGNGSLDKAAGGWQPLAPSALPFDDGWPTPHAMSLDEIAALKENFVATTRRAARLGIDL